MALIANALRQIAPEAGFRRTSRVWALGLVLLLCPANVGARSIAEVRFDPEGVPYLAGPSPVFDPRPLNEGPLRADPNFALDDFALTHGPTGVQLPRGFASCEMSAVIGQRLSANAGLAFDKGLRAIYACTSPGDVAFLSLRVMSGPSPVTVQGFIVGAADIAHRSAANEARGLDCAERTGTGAYVPVDEVDEAPVISPPKALIAGPREPGKPDPNIPNTSASAAGGAVSISRGQGGQGDGAAMAPMEPAKLGAPRLMRCLGRIKVDGFKGSWIEVVASRGDVVLHLTTACLDHQCATAIPAFDAFIDTLDLTTLGERLF